VTAAIKKPILFDDGRSPPSAEILNAIDEHWRIVEGQILERMEHAHERGEHGTDQTDLDLLAWIRRRREATQPG
jgi:hypothetical protein